MVISSSVFSSNYLMNLILMERILSFANVKKGNLKQSKTNIGMKIMSANILLRVNKSTPLGTPRIFHYIVIALFEYIKKYKKENIKYLHFISISVGDFKNVSHGIL